MIDYNQTPEEFLKSTIHTGEILAFESNYEQIITLIKYDNRTTCSKCHSCAYYVFQTIDKNRNGIGFRRLCCGYTSDGWGNTFDELRLQAIIWEREYT